MPNAHNTDGECERAQTTVVVPSVGFPAALGCNVVPHLSLLAATSIHIVPL